MTKPSLGAGKSSRFMRYLRCWEPGALSAGQPLVGAVPAAEPPGREGRRAFRRRFGTGFDRRERGTAAGDEGEFGDAPRVVVRNDLLIAPGHHVLGPPVQELGSVHDE